MKKVSKFEKLSVCTERHSIIAADESSLKVRNEKDVKS